MRKEGSHAGSVSLLFFDQSIGPTHRSDTPTCDGDGGSLERASERARPVKRGEGVTGHRSALMAVVGPSRHSRVSMSVSIPLMQGGGAGATGAGGGGAGAAAAAAAAAAGAHPGQAVLAAAAAAAAAAQAAPPTYYHPAAPAPPPPPPAQDPIQPDRPIGYGAFGVVW
ncbi:hypothetical protein HN011_001148 [Eciton burchellii]|nr:hypothetical protein HN011_001148 [Eciton burchellii]